MINDILRCDIYSRECLGVHLTSPMVGACGCPDHRPTLSPGPLPHSFSFLWAVPPSLTPGGRRVLSPGSLTSGSWGWEESDVGIVSPIIRPAWPRVGWSWRQERRWKVQMREIGCNLPGVTSCLPSGHHRTERDEARIHRSATGSSLSGILSSINAHWTSN